MNHDERAELLQRIERRCTPYQYGVFRKVLTAVRNTLARERVSFAYFAEDGNDAFLETVERVLVEGMANAPEPQPLTEPEPADLNPVREQLADVEEYRPTYWWQD